MVRQETTEEETTAQERIPTQMLTAVLIVKEAGPVQRKQNTTN